LANSTGSSVPVNFQTPSTLPVTFQPSSSIKEEKKLSSPMKDVEMVLGIDEAGRGPILGPMTYACVFFPLSKKKLFKSFGFQDSKKISSEKRESLFEDIKNSKEVEISYLVKSISAAEISQQMLKSTKVSLNEISHSCVMDLIREALDGGFNITQVFVDTVGPKEKFQEKLKKRFPNIPKIIVEEKADSKYSVVSAASICAKVIRDKQLADYEFIEDNITDRSFGSGYPGDSVTLNWLERNRDTVFGFSSLVRFSWKPSQDQMELFCAKVKWSHLKSNQGVLDFSTRSRFFKDNNLEIPYHDF